MLKSENGITLIGLIVTIIVLLILTAATIGEAVGQNGVITMALKASWAYTDAQTEEVGGYAPELIKPTAVYVKLYENGLLAFDKTPNAIENNGDYIDYGDISQEVYSLEHLPPWITPIIDYGTGEYEYTSKVKAVKIFPDLVPTDMSYWFAYLSNIDVFTLLNVDISRVNSIKGLFYNCSGAKAIYVRNSSWKNISSPNVFDGCGVDKVTFVTAKDI